MKVVKARNDAVARIATSAWILLGFSIGSALAETTADGPQQGPAHASPPQQTESIQAPQIDGIPADPAAPVIPGELFYRIVSPLGPFDKGSVRTDVNEGMPTASPTAGERAKLEMARAAMEAARAAGTLYVTPPANIHGAPPPEASQAKLDALHATPPAQLPPDPAAGVGVVIPPIQLVGPPELSPAEIQKLADQGRNGGTR